MCAPTTWRIAYYNNTVPCKINLQLLYCRVDTFFSALDTRRQQTIYFYKNLVINLIKLIKRKTEI